MITLDGEKFEIGKLNAFEQLTLLRKLATATPVLQQVVAPENQGKDRSLLVMFALSQVKVELPSVTSCPSRSVALAIKVYVPFPPPGKKWLSNI